jgi:hypothetical protein
MMILKKKSPLIVPICLLFLLVFSLPVSALQAFFDNDKKTLFAPQDPELSELDLDVLELCGPWGSHVEAVDFEKMMLSKNNQSSVSRLRKDLGNRIFSAAIDNKDFVHQLRRVWFEQKGFQHVFCGEPNKYDLGGFHYAARYWQAQDKKWAGYRKLKKNYRQRPIKKCQQFYLKEQIKPPIYNTSISYIDPETNKQKVKCLSGYNHLMSAEDILLAGTQAFKQANKRVSKNAKEACLFKTNIKDVPKHYNKLVIKQRALRTFYPLADKRPYCKKNKKDISACFCSKL